MIWVRIVLTTHPSLVIYSIALYPLSRKERHTAVVATIEQALGGGHEKSIVGKKFRCQFGNAGPYLFIQALHMPRSKNSSGVYRPKYKIKKGHFLIVSLSIFPRSRRGAERIRQGEGRWSRPPKTKLERSYLTENSSSANRILRPRRKKTHDRIPEKKSDRIYIF